MKTILVTVLIATLAAAAAILIMLGSKKGQPLPNEPVTEPASVQTNEDAQRPEPAVHGARLVAPVTAKQPERAPQTSNTAAESYAVLEALSFGSLVETLVSPRAGYDQKQTVWKQLRESGKLDSAIQELEQRMANEPRVAEIPAALGQAYLQKCGTLQDVREQGILAIQADKVFDAALSLDPGNWEARFTKAMAMSYWPANMGKTEEVMQHFQYLIQQQEAQAPQAHFAETYSWLGSQYLKTGHNAEARAVWERGAALFPNHDGLTKKLAGASVAQNSTSAANP